MKVEATGRLIKKTEVETFPSGFSKRTFVIEVQNGQYTNPFEFELVKDDVDLINGFKKDELISVKVVIKLIED